MCINYFVAIRLFRVSSRAVLTAKKAALEKADTEAKLAEELVGILPELVLL